MKYTLIKWSSNWADEMNIEGFTVVKNKYADLLKERILSFKHHLTMGVGTNEEIPFEDGKALLKSLTFTKISDEQFAVFKEFFQASYLERVECSFGHTPFEQFLDDEEWEYILEDENND